MKRFYLIFVITVFFFLFILGCGTSNEKQGIKESSEQFIVAFFENDFEKAKNCIIVDDEMMDEASVRGGFEATSNLLNYFIAAGQTMTGMKTQLFYEVKDIKLTDDEHARILYVIGSNVSDEKMEINATFIKSEEKWKLYFPSFMTSLMFE